MLCCCRHLVFSLKYSHPEKRTAVFLPQVVYCSVAAQGDKEWMERVGDVVESGQLATALGCALGVTYLTWLSQQFLERSPRTVLSK